MSKTPPVKKESVEDLKKRAESGDVNAQTALGLLYELGIDVPKTDPQEAAKWWGKAAKAGSPVAQFSLAEIITKEFEDTEENRTMAQALYKKAETTGLVRPDKALRLFEKQLGKSWKVLVVDYSGPSRLVARNLLEAEGCEVFEAKNGEEALQIIRRNLDLKLVLTETHMPVIDGFSMMTSVRANEQMKHIPIVVMSDEQSAEAIQKAKKIGINGWIVKPAKPQILRRYIQMLNSKAAKTPQKAS